MGLSVEDAARCPTSGYSIDMLVDDAQGRAWAVEFDGPSHFLEIPSGSPRPTGATVLKRRLLQLLGHALVSVPYGEWDSCKGAAEREQYLRGKLEALGRSHLCTSAHADVLPGSHGTTESLDTAAKGKKARRRKGQKQGQATADAGDAADAAPSLQAPLERDEELADQGQQAEATEDDFKEDDLRQTVGLPVGASAADPAATSSSLQQRKHAKRRKKPRSRDNEQQTVACERGSRWSELARIVCLCALMACSGLWIYFQILPQALRPFFQFFSSWSSFSGRS